jgi:mannose-1-phosphate guanylyltransferase
MLHAVIMAGGSGTRFWPVSRRLAPKQLLELTPGGSMLRQTVDRLEGLIPPDRCLVVTGESLTSQVASQLPELPDGNIVAEPCRRDTAPCVGLAALLVSLTDENATMAVMPADHVIQPREALQSAIRQADTLIDGEPSLMVTFGIKPTYAAEVFGYIQRDVPLAWSTDEEFSPTYSVAQFREKPDCETASEYLKSGEYYWNSGIFVWRARTILEALAERQPRMMEHLQTIARAWGAADQQQVLQREFAAIEPISIDYAVMEHATNIAVIEAPSNGTTWGAGSPLADDWGSTKTRTPFRAAISA